MWVEVEKSGAAGVLWMGHFGRLSSVQNKILMQVPPSKPAVNPPMYLQDVVRWQRCLGMAAAHDSQQAAATVAAAAAAAHITVWPSQYALSVAAPAGQSSPSTGRAAAHIRMNGMQPASRWLSFASSA